MTSFVLTSDDYLECAEPLDPVDTSKCLSDPEGYITFTEVGTGNIISIASRNIRYVIHHK